MSNSIDIKYRADTSQSVVATDKLLARITKLEGQLSTAVGKSSKVGSALGKSYADAEARVKHFEKALKSATSVTTKYRALEGLQAAVRAFKVAKSDFEDSMKVGHDPGLAIDQVAQATSKLSAVQANAWNAEQSQLRASASLRQDIISRMTAQVALEKQLSQDKAIASAKQLATVQANAWNSEQSRLRASAALRQDIISRLTAQVALEKQVAQQTAMQDHIAGAGIRFGQGSRRADPLYNNPVATRDAHNQTLREDITSRLTAEVEERRRRGRELDAKQRAREVASDLAANSRRGSEVFDSESTLTDRRSLLKDRMQNASPNSLNYKNMLAELAQVEAALKRIASLQKDAVSPGKTRAAVDLTSVKALRMQIKWLKSEMDNVGAGAQWDVLNNRLALAEAEMADVTRQATDARKAVSAAATAPTGSWMRLGYELEQAKLDLSKLTVGTKEFLAQQSKVAGLQKAWDNVNNAINKTNKSQRGMGSVTDSLLGQAKGMLATYVGMHQALAQVNAEWTRYKAMQESMKNAGLELGSELIRQAPNIDIENSPAVKQFARDNSFELGADPDQIVKLVGAASSTGAKNVGDAMRATAAVLKLTSGDAEMASDLLPAGVMTANINNSDNFKAGLGQIRASSKASLAVNEAEFNKNTLKAVTGLTRGTRRVDALSTERAYEIITAGSRMMGDTEGSRIATALMSGRSSMNTFNPQQKKKLKDGSTSIVDKETLEKFKNTRDFDTLMFMMKNNEALRNQFLDHQRRGDPQNTSEAFLMPNKLDREYIQMAKDAIPAFNAGEAVFNSVVKQQEEANPFVISERKKNAGVKAAISGDQDFGNAQAFSSFNEIFAGNTAKNLPALDLSGWDQYRWAEGMHAVSTAIGSREYNKLPPNEGAVYAAGVEELIRGEKARGGDKDRPAVLKALEAILASLKITEKGIDELNAQVAAGRNAPPPAPRPVAPVAQAPPVPRMPAMNLNARGGDVFGWFKK